MVKRISVSVSDEFYETMDKWKASFNYSEVCRGAIEEAIQKTITTHWHGEQPIGTSMLVATSDSSDEKQEYIAHTPTMRLPELSVGTDHPYVAMRAVLREVANYDPEFVIATTGLATGCGRVSPESAAQQMRLAWVHHHAAAPVMPGDSHRGGNWGRTQQHYKEVEEAIKVKEVQDV